VSTVRRSGKPLTVTDVVAAGRKMLRAGTPTNPREIQERMAAIDAVMGCLNGPNYGTDFYAKLGQEWSRLAAVLSGGSGVASRRGAAVPVRVGGSVAAGWETRSARDYAAAEAAWQRDPARLELARRHRQIPASWRLPERPQRKADIPTIRLDADTAPRVTVNLPGHAFAVIEAACIRSGDLETGGWLSGHQPREWHRDRGILQATVSVRHRSTDSVTLDADEFIRWDADLRADRREGGGDFRALGGWHSHPVCAAMPSAADLDCWAHRLSTMIDPGSSLTTLITARRDPDRDSWRNPRITAWITRHARSSFGERMVCEPANVSVR
jgi:proteasome lid subunit RPN8/RPN11